MHKLKCLKISFEDEIANYELPAFRGAIAHKVGLEHTSDHHHSGDKSYIQNK